MAIKVKTGMVEQQKADASVFGYQQTFTSPLSAVSNALKDTAQAVGSIGGDLARNRVREQTEQARAQAAIAKKQAAVDKSIADTAISRYNMSVESSAAALTDAYATENEEDIAIAEAAFSKLDPKNANFTLDYEGGRVSDPTYYQANGYMNTATEKWFGVDLKNRGNKAQIKLKNIVKTARGDASEGLHKAMQNNLNKPMNTTTFDNTLMGIAAAGNNEALGALTSEAAVTAFQGDASGMVSQLFIHNLKNSRSIDEVNQFAAKGVEQYGDMLEFVNEADRKSIIAAAEKRVEDLTKDGNKLLQEQNKAALDQTANTFFNTLSQASTIENMVAVSEATANSLMDIDPTHLSADSDIETYVSAARIAKFFQPRKVVNADGEEIVSSPFRQELITLLSTANKERKLPEYVLDGELLSMVRPDDRGKLSQYVNNMASKIHKGLQNHDTRVLGLLTPHVLEQAVLLKKLGYEDMAIVTDNNIEFSKYDLNSSAEYVKQFLTDNTNGATAQYAYNITVDPDSTPDERNKAFALLVGSTATSPQEAADVTKAVVTLTNASDRFDQSAHTPMIQILLNGAASEVATTSVMTSSEIYNKYKVALQTGDVEVADMYQKLFQGLVVSVTDAHADDIMNVNDPGFFSIANFTDFMAGPDRVLRAKIENTFFTKESEMLINKLGIDRITENGTKVTLLPSMLNAIDLEYRKPMNVFLESMLSSPIFFGQGVNTVEAISEGTYSFRQTVKAAITKGDYSVLPEPAANRTAEIYAIELAENGNLEFTPELVKKIPDLPAGFRDMVEEFKLATEITNEERAEILQEGKVRVGGAVFPLIDYTHKTFKNGEIAIAPRYYNRSSGRYENLIDLNNNQVMITGSAAANRLELEGGWNPKTRETLELLENQSSPFEFAEDFVESIRDSPPIIVGPTL